MDCSHCGDICQSDAFKVEDHVFCCAGCQSIFELFDANGLNKFYELENQPGKKSTGNSSFDYEFLDLEESQSKYLLYKSESLAKVELFTPQIHCSSCIWLLENLRRLNYGVITSSVSFNQKRATVHFNPKKISFRELVELLAKIGYAPDFSEAPKNSNKHLIYKIGVAGFCFGNIMLISFPEYLGIDDSQADFKRFFGILSLILTVPVFFYSGKDYLSSALKSAQQKYINIDVPIAIGMFTLLIRSSYEIISQTGSGYLDSLSGLIFFLLIGKWFQKKTYDTINFDRDYRSYFPIAVQRLNPEDNSFELTEIKHLTVGDVLEIRNGELIPADATLIEGNALIDYTFVTGEADLVRAEKEALIYAGGRQSGTTIKVKTIKPVNNSYLTDLWNDAAFSKPKTSFQLDSLSNTVSKYFTIIILIIAMLTGVYWSLTDSTKLWQSVSSVLIVACPCALALSVPFTLGNATRILAQKGLFLKSSSIVEQLAKITSIVLDKTGTLTYRNRLNVAYNGNLKTEEITAVKSLARHSIHPLSAAICNNLKSSEQRVVKQFTEESGKGISGYINGHYYKLGSYEFVGQPAAETSGNGTVVALTKDHLLMGVFNLSQTYRVGLKELMISLKHYFKLHLLSGDNDSERKKLSNWLKLDKLNFNVSPGEKLEYVKQLTVSGEKVLMIGDGLNDAGALKQSHVGVAISDKEHQFSPASDAILKAENFNLISKFIEFSRSCVTTIKLSFVISFIYNIVGLAFAVSGNLSPIVAAVLMPISSMSIVLFSTFSTKRRASVVFAKP